MAKNNKADMSCARVKKYTASDVSKAERHNERKNETYENMNVIEERIPFNVHFKTPTAPTYMEQLKQMETDGLVSLRGLRKDATIFNEIVIDVNTMYFERNGGYEYAKQFYEEAFQSLAPKMGRPNEKELKAKEFLLEMLKDGEMLSSDCEEKLEAAGFKKSTIKKAKKKAGVISRKQGFLWYWSLPMGDMPRA